MCPLVRKGGTFPKGVSGKRKTFVIFCFFDRAQQEEWRKVADESMNLKLDTLLPTMEEYLKSDRRKDLNEANAQDIHHALSKAIMAGIADDWKESIALHNEARHAYYMSAEFLIGRAIYNNLLCLGIYDDVEKLFSEHGLDLNMMEEVEDASLGNGGLGRLAACFLDSAATQDLPLDG